MKYNRDKYRLPLHDKRAQDAALPFHLLERFEIPSGYEHSFKLSAGELLANRYLLGISLEDTTPDCLQKIFLQLKMPESLLDQFHHNLPDANLVFLGFEDDGQRSSYRVYLEYWDKICEEIRRAPNKIHPRLMFLGYKWNIQHPDRQVISEYICHPLLSTSEIIDRIKQLYQASKDDRVCANTCNIIQHAASQCADRSFIYLEVGEGDNLRSSFDLNIYKSGLCVQDIGSILTGISHMDQPVTAPGMDCL